MMWLSCGRFFGEKTLGGWFVWKILKNSLLVPWLRRCYVTGYPIRAAGDHFWWWNLGTGCTKRGIASKTSWIIQQALWGGGRDIEMCVPEVGRCRSVTGGIRAFLPIIRWSTSQCQLPMPTNIIVNIQLLTMLWIVYALTWLYWIYIVISTINLPSMAIISRTSSLITLSITASDRQYRFRSPSSKTKIHFPQNPSDSITSSREWTPAIFARKSEGTIRGSRWGLYGLSPGCGATPKRIRSSCRGFRVSSSELISSSLNVTYVCPLLKNGWYLWIGYQRYVSWN